VLGREQEVALLLQCHQRVAATSTMEVVLISGYSGIGKTSLVGELKHVKSTGTDAFVQGKFDQYSRDTPFKAIIMAVQVKNATSECHMFRLTAEFKRKRSLLVFEGGCTAYQIWF
jgi:predicted ATPase